MRAQGGEWVGLGLRPPVSAMDRLRDQVQVVSDSVSVFSSVIEGHTERAV